MQRRKRGVHTIYYIVEVSLLAQVNINRGSYTSGHFIIMKFIEQAFGEFDKFHMK